MRITHHTGAAPGSTVTAQLLAPNSSATAAEVLTTISARADSSSGEWTLDLATPAEVLRDFGAPNTFWQITEPQPGGAGQRVWNVVVPAFGGANPIAVASLAAPAAVPPTTPALDGGTSTSF